MDRRLILIDGFAVIYRAYYAIRELSTSDGRPTNAVFGFIRMLDQIRDAWKPTHWAVIFDGGLPEERTEILKEYKAQRDPMPDQLRVQIDVIQDYLDAASITWAVEDRQEADDLIASVCDQMSDCCDEVLIASSDKDLFQLVNGKVNMISVAGEPKRMGPVEISSKTGVGPELIPAWLALVGDSSDNISGVPGVGPKTAASLLQEFGSISKLLTSLDMVARKKIETALRDHTDIIKRNMAVVTLRKNLRVPFDWAEIEYRKPDPSRLIPVLEGLEFDSMVKSLREPELF